MSFCYQNSLPDSSEALSKNYGNNDNSNSFMPMLKNGIGYQPPSQLHASALCFDGQKSSTHWTQKVPVSMPWQDNCNSFSGFGSTSSSLDVMSSTDTIFNTNPYISRKRSSTFDGEPSTKQFISESKVAEKFGQLHIGGDYNVPLISSEEQAQTSTYTTFEDLSKSLGEHLDFDEISGSKEEPSLVLSDELSEAWKYKLEKSSDPLIDKILQPSMAVVLWKPPGGIIKDLIKSSVNNVTKTEDVKKDDMEKEIDQMDEDDMLVEDSS